MVQLLILGFIQAGFNCVPATNSSGTAIGGTICTHAAITTSTFTLDEPVSIYVPSTTTSTVNHVVLYFQGFRGVCGDTGTTPGSIMNVFNLAQQMETDAVAGSVFVFPMSVGDDTTYYNDFASSGGPFLGFMQWIESAVGTSVQWSLAGHSGAGDIIAKSLNLNPTTIPKFNAIELLDAAYSMSDSSEIALWQKIAQLNPTLAVTCIGNGTYAGCQELAANAGFTKSVVVTQTSIAHCQIPNNFFGPWLPNTGSAQYVSK